MTSENWPQRHEHRYRCGETGTLLPGRAHEHLLTVTTHRERDPQTGDRIQLADGLRTRSLLKCSRTSACASEANSRTVLSSGGGTRSRWSIWMSTCRIHRDRAGWPGAEVRSECCHRSRWSSWCGREADVEKRPGRFRRPACSARSRGPRTAGVSTGLRRQASSLWVVR